MSKILIEQNLFMELVKFHCFEMYDDPIRNEYIKKELEKKLNQMAERQRYSENLKNNKTP